MASHSHSSDDPTDPTPLPGKRAPEVTIPVQAIEWVEIDSDPDKTDPGEQVGSVAPVDRVPISRHTSATTQGIIPKSGRPLAMAVATVSMLLGMAIAFVVRFGADPVPTMREQIFALDPPPSQLVVRYDGSHSPPPAEVEMAQDMLAEARGDLAAKRIDDAERLLGFCIRLADLAECHRALASVLALTGRPGGRAHLELYLERAADCPDRSALTSVLHEKE